MKKLSLFFLMFLMPFEISAQKNNRFDLLQGFEDSTGTTHLTFTFSTTGSQNAAWPDCPAYYLTFIDLLHYNTATNSDSVLVTNNASSGFCGPAGTRFFDVEAINNDPENIVVAGTYSDGFEPYGYLHFLATDAQTYPLFQAYEDIFIDPLRPDSIFLNQYSSDRTVLIIPGDIEQGELELITYSDFDVPDDTARKFFNWYEGFHLNGFSPFRDSVLFGEPNGDGLEKSDDFGKTISEVDESIFSYYLGHVYFDADSQHVYRVKANRLRVSDQFGEPESWVEREKPMDKRFEIETDLTTSGKLYSWSLDTTLVLISTDYGNNFETLFRLDNNIRGVHKSTADESLYILTTNELFEYKNQQLISLKQVPVSKEPNEEVPASVALQQNYPNPFNPSTIISYELTNSSLVRLDVYDITGRKVDVLVNGERKSAGTHQATFDAGNLSSGLYFYRLETAGKTLTRKMLLVK